MKISWTGTVLPASVAAVLLILLVGLFLLLGIPADRPAHEAGPCPWMDTSRTPDERAGLLVSAMSLEEKLGELYGRGMGPDAHDAANAIPGIPGLCLPELVLADAGAGVGDGIQGATAFPVGIAQAATWDPELQQRVGAAIGTEAWLRGINIQLAPAVNIVRNPLEGRGFEYPGEDPYLAGQTAAAIVRGIQSRHVVATVKHLAVNDQETDRMTNSSDVDERTLQEIHLPAFEAAVKAGAGAVMCGYNRVNGVFACQNKDLITGYLKDRLGFTGWAMSDWDSTFSTVTAADAGLDQEMALKTGQRFGAELKAAVLSGQVPESRVNDMVNRLMRSLFSVGAFDHPAAEPAPLTPPATPPEHRALAAQAAAAGTVLLKNTDGVLPLSPKIRSIAVIGQPAGEAGAQHAYHGGGSSRVPMRGDNPLVISPFQGLKERAARDGITVTYTDGAELPQAAAAARAADIAVVVAAGSSNEGVDRPSLALDNASCALFGPCSPARTSPDRVIAAAAAANPHTVVVLQSGGPVSMPWLDDVQGVLENWFPGQEDGNALAAVLFGDVDPGGRLPVTFPRSLAESPITSEAQWPGVQVPGDPVGTHSEYTEGLLVGYRWYDAKGVKPLFPFGFGLSYTRFAYSGLTVEATPDGARVGMTVSNVGSRKGTEVAQLYVGAPAETAEPPRQLKGFRKVELEPGASTHLVIDLEARAFQQWSELQHHWVTGSGTYTIQAGGSSTSLPLSATLRK
ncbi:MULTISPECIES: glycoside hydrolase family 3 C-terminal domain-containing protein [Arthrobacter]|uniref:Glycoside hydrolase family 3 C-terminal domain-containing protein n=2 Tax=Arthrobacter TaxID=1663 RepID=A0ABU9KIK5_9MICC|nr:glycoside hydrolase family 3 C-terminal domain-containing protein [Arthrobacter sp. YJM1]MDP5226362.1 glycoside hydrolase family 3 C-terminal domain-containing protein [Arthrobacter sp. YJM1]